MSICYEVLVRQCKTDMLVKDRYICKYELSGKWSGVLLCCSVTVNDTEQLKPISSIKLVKRESVRTDIQSEGGESRVDDNHECS